MNLLRIADLKILQINQTVLKMELRVKNKKINVQEAKTKERKNKRNDQRIVIVKKSKRRTNTNRRK